MSYCVHCGVELDSSLKRCPLCNTPVIDPKNIPYYETSSPYPSKKGQVEPVKQKDVALLVSILLFTIGVTCFLLNHFVFPRVFWSLLVMGFCLLTWVFCIPFLIYRKLSPYLSAFLDFLAISFYLYLISRLTGSSEWLFYLGLPITALFALLSELCILLIRRINRSRLFIALYFFSYIAIACVGIELLCRNFLEQHLHITWSAVVLTVCAVFIIAIITVLRLPRLREETRKRLHF